MGWKVLMHFDDGTSEEDDEVFSTEEAAEEYGLYLSSCASLGAEILHMSNPGDYPDDDADLDYEIIEVD